MHTSSITVPTGYGLGKHGAYSGETTYDCHHNGDYSGDIRIITRKGELHYEASDFHEAGPDIEEVRIPFEVMKRLVADWVRQRRISILEVATDAEVLLP